VGCQNDSYWNRFYLVRPQRGMPLTPETDTNGFSSLWSSADTAEMRYEVSNSPGQLGQIWHASGPVLGTIWGPHEVHPTGQSARRGTNHSPAVTRLISGNA
jgi:hypothetical protein